MKIKELYIPPRHNFKYYMDMVYTDIDLWKGLGITINNAISDYENRINSGTINIV
jgi:hypothetical protein